MTNNLAPILLFTYNRLDTLKCTVDALKKNLFAQESTLYIFCDGPKMIKDEKAVQEVRSFVRTIKGFKSVILKESKTNKGLANSIIEGVSQVLTSYESVIVIEDDLVTSENFINYMNGALDFYRSNLKVFSISGFTCPVTLPANYIYDNYFTNRGASWGWATWRDRWVDVDWQVKDFHTFSSNRQVQKDFNGMGSDLTGMLKKQIQGKINSWAIRWTYHQFKIGGFSVYPVTSKVLNIGFGVSATHTKQKHNRFRTFLDNSGAFSFNFNDEVGLHPLFNRQFVARYSLKSRLYSKLRNLISI